MKDITFYYCASSKSFLLDIGESSSRCRSDGLEFIEPNTVDAAAEKHVPVIGMLQEKLEIRVGEQLHPMLPEHYIQWIFLQTTTGGLYRKLQPGDMPRAAFTVKRDEVVGIYAYCNLHGLWKAGRSELAKL